MIYRNHITEILQTHYEPNYDFMTSPNVAFTIINKPRLNQTEIDMIFSSMKTLIDMYYTNGSYPTTVIMVYKILMSYLVYVNKDSLNTNNFKIQFVQILCLNILLHLSISFIQYINFVETEDNLNNNEISTNDVAALITDMTFSFDETNDEVLNNFSRDIKEKADMNNNNVKLLVKIIDSYIV